MDKIASLIHQIEQADAAFDDFNRPIPLTAVVSLAEAITESARHCPATAVLGILAQGKRGQKLILHSVTRCLAQTVLNRLQAESEADDEV